MSNRFLILPIIVGLLSCQAFGAPEKQPGADAPQARSALLSWIGVNRQVIRARFIRKEETAIVLELESGEHRPVPITSFSPQSLKQADEEAEKLGDQSIARIRGIVFVPIKSGRFTMGSPLKDFLTARGSSEKLYGSRDATRAAFAAELIENGDAWMEMIKHRNESSHTYNDDVAVKIMEAILAIYVPAFEAFQSRFLELEKEESA